MQNPLVPVILSSVLAGALGAAVAIGLAPRGEAPTQARAAEPSAPDLSREVARLAAAQAELNARLEELAQQPREVARPPVEDVGAAVERYLAAPAELAPDADAQRVEAAMAQLLGGELDDNQVQALWAELGKAGLSDELVAAFEARVERDPNDPDLQVELGSAYLQKIFEVGNGPAAGVWAMKADGAFDAALALDERHWDARFSKAVSLSFWPPALGKQNAAIEQFELLLSQQKGQAAEPRFAQTYLFLGNMYQQTGQPEKALSTWQEGLSQYPGSTELSGQVELMQKQP